MTPRKGIGNLEWHLRMGRQHGKAPPDDLRICNHFCSLVAESGPAQVHLSSSIKGRLSPIQSGDGLVANGDPLTRVPHNPLKILVISTRCPTNV